MSKNRLLNLIKRRTGIRLHQLRRPLYRNSNHPKSALALWSTWGFKSFGKQQIQNLVRLGQPMVVMHTG